jgi:hypothetical protein
MSSWRIIIGLTSAFLFARSRSLVTSPLERVNDESTRLFMELFNANLNSGRCKAGTQRQARLQDHAEANLERRDRRAGVPNIPILWGAVSTHRRVELLRCSATFSL